MKTTVTALTTKTVLLFLAIAGAACSAMAETRLTDFNGVWQGAGEDRRFPFERMQRTKCQTNIHTDLRQMTARTKCIGDAGLNKSITLSIFTEGDAFSGSLTQIASIAGDTDSPTVLKGSVSGQKTNSIATFQVRFSGLIPTVTVTLNLIKSTSYTMLARTLGGTLMDVTFNRSEIRE